MVRRGCGRAACQCAFGLADKRRLDTQRLRPPNLNLGIRHAIDAKEEDRIGRVNVWLGAGSPGIHIDGSFECPVSIIDATETDVCVRERGPCREIEGIELQRALECPRCRGEPLHILIETPE